MTQAPEFPQQVIDEIIAALPGDLGLVIKDLATGTRLERNSQQRFPTASVFKLPIMVELFRQVQAGRLSLEGRYAPHEGICSHGTGALKAEAGQPELTLHELCKLMIAQSDNVATDLILEIIGLESVNRTMDELGYADTRVSMPIGRWHYCMVGLDNAPINSGNDALLDERVRAGQIDFEALPFTDSLKNNVTSAADMARMLEEIYRGELISPEASSAMLEMLKACEHRGLIPRDLDPGVPVAHKIGQSRRIRADVGIVLLPARPLIISILSLVEEVGPQRPGVQAIARIARLAVQQIDPQAVLPPEAWPQ